MYSGNFVSRKITLINNLVNLMRGSQKIHLTKFDKLLEMPSPPPETTILTPFHPGKNSGSAHATYIIYYKYFAFMVGTKHNPFFLAC